LNSGFYPYASGNPLETRNNYSYSVFGGTDFLEAWRERRVASLSGIRTATTEHQQQGAESPTGGMLARLQRAFLERRYSPEDFALLDRLIQRFEVSKRLHAAYNTEFRPVDPDDFRNLEHYVRFAEALDAAYTLDAGLSRLNALLKCLDTLIALKDLLGAGQRMRLDRLIRSEEKHVSDLERKLGVSKGA
jgi:hypothetical protein